MIFHVKKDFLISGDGEDIIGHISFKYITAKYIDFEKRIGCWIRLERKNGHLYISDQHPILGETYKVNGKKYTCNQFQNLKDEKSELLLIEIGQGMSILAHTGEIELV